MLSRRLLRIKAIKTLYAHFKSESDNLMASEKTMLSSINKTYELYFQMLWLIVEIARYAEQKQESAKQKKLPTYEDLNPNTKFVDNTVIRLIENSDSVTDYIAKYKLSWSNYPELIRTLYTQLIESDYYKKYMSTETRSFADDKSLVEAFYSTDLEQSEALEDVLDEQSILWNDDLGFALIMVLRTLSNARQSHEELKVLPKFKSEDDLAFVKTLFEKSLIKFADNQKYIDQYTQNWDVERLAFMDTIIMCTAITELVEFPSIPVKVTLDEYIEISKYYSTPGSSTFINGVLDKVVESLRESGKMQKVGRGLI